MRIEHKYRMGVYIAIEKLRPYFPTDGVHVMEEDWDSLLVLNSCRADLFEEVAELDTFDKYDRVNSLGSMTAEWARLNFQNRSFPDTVNVTTNPHVPRVAPDSFHDTIAVFTEHFDDDKGTIYAEDVVDSAYEAHENYPSKRLLVHFLQPHQPFIRDPELIDYSGWDPRYVGADENPSGIGGPWEALARGLLSKNELWTAYRGNLEYVIEPALELARSLPGRTVITSDHGNMDGEMMWPVPVRGYGHPRGVRHPSVIEVPWAVVESGDRPHITSDGTSEYRISNEVDVGDQLSALGYK